MSSSNPVPTESTPKPPRKPRWLIWCRWIVLIGVVGVAAAMLFTWLAAGDTSSSPEVVSIADQVEPSAQAELIVMSVNCAHGRGEGFHQALTSTKTLKANCELIGKLLNEQQVDIAFLQECDAPSIWSGRFDHAKAIAESASLPKVLQALNVDGVGLHYGTALVSRFAIADPLAYTFKPSPPTFSKGVAIARVAWPGDSSFEFDVVSIHLDFASGTARDRQVDELVDVLSERACPVIIAGDLNCNWSEDGATKRLVKKLRLTAYEPESDMVTFPFTGERLDWVLVSNDFEITSVKAIDARVSDHRPLRAVIRRR